MNILDYAINELDNRVVSIDTSKALQSDLNQCVKSIDFNDKTGVFTVNYFNGTKSTIDTLLEKVIVNFSYNSSNQKLEFRLEDGTVQEIDMSEFVQQYEFQDSDTIAFSVSETGTIQAEIIDGSITTDKLDANFFAYMQNLGAQYVEAAQTAASASQGSADDSASSAILAESYAHGGTESREDEDTDNSKYFKELSESYCHGGTNIRENEVNDNAEYYKNICESVSTQSATLLQEAKDTLEDAQRRVGTITIRLNPETGYMEQTESAIYKFRYNESTGYLERAVDE